MSMPLSPTRLFVCKKCGATLPVSEEHIGKKCRCGRCGKVSLVTGDDSPPEQSAAAIEAAAEAEAEAKREAGEKHVHFPCRVCNTHLAAKAKYEGRKAKCPDCGARTAVPPAPKVRKPQKPKAMHGEQYGLWDVGDAPSPAELAKHQPKFIPVYCSLCNTLMHARMEQVGKKLTCPDCGVKTLVKEPPKETKQSALVPDGMEYQLDTTHVPPPRPERQFTPPERKPDANVEQEPERQEFVVPERPQIPSFPTLVGVPAMLVRSPVLGWAVWLILCGLVDGGLILAAIAGHTLLAVILIPLVLTATVIGVCLASAISLCVITESSEGNDRLYQPPGMVFYDWMADMLFFITSGTLAMAPWWGLTQVLKQDVPMEYLGMLTAVGWLFTFPLFLLSCLENGSPMELYSSRVFGSVVRRPGHWLLFVAQSLVLVGGCLVAVAAMLVWNPMTVWLAVPLGVSAMLIYVRTLGRFAWWLAESLPVEEK